MCQYIYRLIGLYSERGVVITVDLDGLVPCGVFPQSVHLATLVCNVLIAAEQGVKSIIPWSFMMGYMPQDIAWCRLCRRLVREYLDRYGYSDTATPGQFVAQVPLFPYPKDRGWAFGFLNYSAMVGAMAKAEAVSLRTIDEGAGVPTKEAHAVSWKSAKWIFDVVRQQKVDFRLEEVDVEEKLTEMEVRALINRAFEVGEGDVAIGLQKAFDMGYMDTPLSSNINIKGLALGVRDIRGACRYLDFGNLAIPEEAKAYHRGKIAERERVQGKKLDYHTLVEEYWTFSNGKLVEA
jgi:methylaspartate mutase epsilon subunit